MTQNFLELAKKGNPQAIAALMNSQLQFKGVTVRTSLKDDCLRIVLESEQIPDEQEMTVFIQEGLTVLSSSAIARVKIFGQQIGDDIPVWSRDIELIGKPEVDIPVRRTHLVEDAVHCPNCDSTQLMATKKGFGVGQAAVGAILLGPVGLASGMIGSNQLILSCMKCGHQWEPGKTTATNESQLNHRVTSAKVKIMGIGERIGLSVFTFVVLGSLGIVLFAIPLIGWIAGIFLLLGAIIYPYQLITGDKDSISKLVGDCPHCRKEVEVNGIKTQDFKCSHCKQKVFIKEQEFHTI